ncbi:unnamed protein product, partial [Musa hybrid cultivar]
PSRRSFPRRRTRRYPFPRKRERGIIDPNGEGEDGDEADRERSEPAGHLLEAEERAAEEGLRTVGALRCR